jgi:hypothetical protein
LPDADQTQVKENPSLPGVPGELSFLGLVATAARLVAKKPFHLVGSFLLVYGLALAVGYAVSPLEDDAAVVGAVGVRIVVCISGAFASAYVSIILADAVAGLTTPRGGGAAALRVHAKELITAGLFSVVLAFPLEFLFPYITFALLGPPILVQVIALEYRPFGDALRRSGALLRGRWARVILVIFAFVVVVLIVFYTFVIYGLPLIVPFYAAGMVALYLDVRARAEKLDPSAFAAERELAMGERKAADPTRD